jgi:hypothetical protein
MELIERPDTSVLAWAPFSPDLTRDERFRLLAYRGKVKDGAVQVSYQQQGCARYYPEGGLLSATMQPKALRSALFGETTFDLDLVNCHPRLFLREMITIEASGWPIHPLGPLKAYVRDRETFLAHERGISFTEGKQIVCSLLNSAQLTIECQKHPDWSPSETFCQLAKCISKNSAALRQYLESENPTVHEQLLETIECSRKRKKSSYIGFALQRLETAIMLDLRKRMLTDIGLDWCAYCFDGSMIENKHREKVDAWLTTLPDDPYVTLRVKPWATPLRRADVPKMLDAVAFSWDRHEPPCDQLPEAELGAECKRRYGLKKAIWEQNVFIDWSTLKAVRIIDRELKPVDQARLVGMSQAYGFWKMKYTAKGFDLVWTPFAKEWLADPHQRMVRRCDFIAPPLVCPEDVYNTFDGFEAERITPEPCDIWLFHEHCRLLMEGQAEWGEWFQDHLADIVQNPGRVNNICCVFQSMPGSGKSTFLEGLFRGILGARYFHTTNAASQIVGQFQSALENKLTVIWEESKAKDGCSAASELKNMITSNTLSIERKGQDPVMMRTPKRIFILTNELDRRSVIIDEGDRRYMVAQASAARQGDAVYMREMFDCVQNPVWLRAVYDHLRLRDLSKYDGGLVVWEKSRPITAAYKNLLEASVAHSVKWLRQLVAVASDMVDGDENDELYLGEVGNPLWTGHYLSVTRWGELYARFLARANITAFGGKPLSYTTSQTKAILLRWEEQHPKVFQSKTKKSGIFNGFRVRPGALELLAEIVPSLY